MGKVASNFVTQGPDTSFRSKGRIAPCKEDLNLQFAFNPQIKWGTNQCNFLMLMILFANMAPASASGACEPPPGSYRDTCVVEGSPYRSTDPNLAKVPMCRFDIRCKDVSGAEVTSEVYMQETMTSCFFHVENCDGRLFVRNDTKRRCKTGKAAREHRKDNRHLEL